MTLEDEIKAMRSGRGATAAKQISGTSSSAAASAAPIRCSDDSDSEAEVEVMSPRRANGAASDFEGIINGSNGSFSQQQRYSTSVPGGKHEVVPGEGQGSAAAPSSPLGQKATLPGECLGSDTGAEAQQVAVNDTALLEHLGLGESGRRDGEGRRGEDGRGGEGSEAGGSSGRLGPGLEGCNEDAVHLLRREWGRAWRARAVKCMPECQLASTAWGISSEGDT